MASLTHRLRRMLRQAFRHCCVSLPCTLVAVLLWATPLQAAEVTLLKPPAQIQRAGETGWRTLRLGDAVQAGDRLRTGHGGADCAVHS